jgi:NACalpha-BTF3-like transcription factor
LEAVGGAQGESKQSRQEKKSRKAILKLGLKAIPDIERITIRPAKKPHFVISRPEVFKSPVSDTYVIFGEAKFDDYAQQAQMQAAESFKVCSQINLLLETCVIYWLLYRALHPQPEPLQRPPLPPPPRPPLRLRRRLPPPSLSRRRISSC